MEEILKNIDIKKDKKIDYAQSLQTILRKKEIPQISTLKANTNEPQTHNNNGWDDEDDLQIDLDPILEKKSKLLAEKPIKEEENEEIFEEQKEKPKLFSKIFDVKNYINKPKDEKNLNVSNLNKPM